MRKAIAAALITTAALIASASAFADVSPTQHLPAAACNQGTMNAHNHIPETTGSDRITPGHSAVPGTANVTPCGHGG